MKEENKLIKEFITIFWIFIIGSIVGSIIETIVGILVDRHFYVKTGLIYGAFIPVYGVGAIMYYLVVRKMKDPTKVFLSTMLLGGIVEYMCSYVQEVFFGTISWDYSHISFNLNGRTSLIHCIFWGILGIFFTVIAYPVIFKFLANYGKKEFKIITMIMIIFMSINIVLSCAAGSRQNERVQQIPADSVFDEFLDKYYPDKRMDRIYANKIVTVKRNSQNMAGESQ